MKCLLITLLCLVVGCSTKSQPPKPPDASNGAVSQPAMQQIGDMPFGQGRLAFYYTADPPRLLQDRVIKGECLEAEIRVGTEVVWRLGSMSESDPDVTLDFTKAPAGRLVVTYHTTDPRRGDESEAPFIETIVTLQPDGRCEETHRILLEKEPYDAAAAAQLAADARATIGSDKEDAENTWEAKLGHLRNMAVDQPDKILPILKELRTHTDAHFSEILDGCIAEVERIQEIRGK